MPTCPQVLPAVQLTLLLAVEAVEVAPAAAVDEGPALGDSLVVVPPQRVALAVPLVQRQATGLACGANGEGEGRSTLVVQSRLAEEEKAHKGKAGDGSQLITGKVSCTQEGTSLSPVQALGKRAGNLAPGKPSSRAAPSKGWR